MITEPDPGGRPPVHAVDPMGGGLELGEGPPAGSLPSRLGSGMVYGYGASVAAMASQLVVTPLLISRVGKEAFGIWSLASLVVVYLGMLNLGFSRATTKLVAEDYGRRPDAVVATVNTSLFVLLGFGAVGLLAGLGIAFAAPGLFDITPRLHGEARLAFGAMAVSVVALIPGGAIGGALVGSKRFDLFALSNLLTVLATGVCNVALVLAGFGVVALAMSTAAISIAGNALRLSMAKRTMPYLRLAPRFIERARVRAAAQLSGWFLTRDLSMLVISRADLVVVGMVLGVREVAVYAVGLKLANLAIQSQTPLVSLFLPHASDVARNGTRSQLADLAVLGTRVALMIGLPISLFLGFMAPNLVHLWVGSGFADAAMVLVFLVIAQSIGMLTNTSWQVLAGMNLVKVSAFVAAIEAVVNLAASIALAHVFGIRGVALGTLVGVTLIDLPVVTFLTCRAVGLPLTAYFRRTIGSHVLPLVVAGGVFVAVRLLVPSGDVVRILIGALASLLYVTLYLRLGATPGERQRVDRLTSRFGVRLA